VRVEVVVPDGLDPALVAGAPASPVEPPADVTVTHPDACPVTVHVDGRSPRVEVRLRPFLSLSAPVGPVGYESTFRVDAELVCSSGGAVTFAAEGPPLSDVRVEGRTFFARTGTLASLRPGELPWGIVPISEAQRGVYTIVATWRGPGHADVTARATVAAFARATGVPSLAIGTPVLLGGAGWHIESGPPGAANALAGNVLRPAQAGRWVLADGAGKKLAVRVGRYDETPLDCGRSDCHPRAASGAADSPMTTVLARGLEGALGAAYDPRCAAACHAVGQPGLADGGFLDVAREIGTSLPAHPAAGAWARLPRALRRLGGVGCTGCHGPGAIPEESARWSILRAEVCATCHDAPPRYAVVAGWRHSKMARSDATPGTSAEGCRDCHTTAGFLAAQKIRPLGAAPPEGVPPLGIACAACHAPHGEHGPTRLLRTPGGKDVCVACHTSPLFTAPGPHAAVSCVGCHDGPGHTFAAVATDGTSRTPSPPRRRCGRRRRGS